MHLHEGQPRTESCYCVSMASHSSQINLERSMLRFTVMLCAAYILPAASVLLAGQMDGEWISVSRVRAGVQQRGEASHAVIRDGKFSTKRDGKLSEQGVISETPGSRPRQYTIEMDSGVEDAGKTFRGIYSISGDTMLTCVNLEPGRDHPEDFSSTHDSGTILIVWARKHGEAARENELDRVFRFLQTNAVNRTLVVENEGSLAQGRVGYSFQREATLCNLSRTANGVSYDIVYVIKQSNWDIVDGRKGSPRIEDRLMVRHFELGRRSSTSEITGYSEVKTTTRASWRGNAETMRVKLDKDRLLIAYRTALYSDLFDKASSFYPGAVDVREEWRLDRGSLVVESQIKTYKVNPSTLDRELIDDPKELFVERQVAQLPLE